MALTTPRFALPYPVAADPNNPPSDILALATVLDNKMVVFLSGPIAGRPAAGTSNRIYWATDTKDVSFDTGTVWRSLTGNPTIGVARYYATTTPASDVTPAVRAWTTTSFNRGGTPTFATKIVIPTAGYWRIHAHQRWAVAGAGAGNCGLSIRRGPNSDTAGTQIAYAQQSAEWTFSYDNDISVEVETIAQFAAGDDFAVWHTASALCSLYGGSDVSYVEYELVTVT
jgi:hypothetical protein